MKLIIRILIFIAIAMPFVANAETVGVFYDSTVDQISFAAGDVKTSLEAKGFAVEMKSLSTLNGSYANKKVVITLSTNNAVTNLFVNQGGTMPSVSGEQSYAIRTTTQGQTSVWIYGFDNIGAMYGGFQMAENINFKGFTSVTQSESPSILKRGVKLNLPLDKESTTYFNANISSGSRNAIPNVWDITFWKTWFDEMARYRYNVVSVWTNHPFTSMIKMADYPDVAIKDVTGYQDINDMNNKNGKLIKTMTIDQKITFWKEVMAYAKSRGLNFYLINWNLFLYGAEGKYGITNDITNPKTVTYMRKCMYELLKTYPDLDGFGITQGEAMGPSDDAQKSIFLGATYGMGMADYAKENPTRKLNFIHRWWLADFTEIKTNFAELLKCSNVTFDMSYKYSFAHMYSSTKPDFFKDYDRDALIAAGLKTWFTVRNDDFYYHNWGSPAYAREYLNNIPGKGTWFKGFYIGSDGFNPTRTFFSKNSVTQGTLEVQRMWYMNMIWGRLSYNLNTSDDVFKNHIKNKLGVSSDNLFEAWQKVSSALPKVGEMIFNYFKNDQAWYPENCQTSNTATGFIKIDEISTADAVPRSPSNQCGIYGTAANTCGAKVTSYAIADQMETDANSALSLISSMSAADNTELGVSLTTVKAMAYLSNYYAYKIRGATYKKANKTTDARNALAKAYCWWIKYTDIMDKNFYPMSMQRNFSFSTWHVHDAAVLKEYTDLGGSGIPDCSKLTSIDQALVSPGVNSNEIEIISVTKSHIVCKLPSNQAYSFKIFTVEGKEITQTHGESTDNGITNLPIGTSLSNGVFIATINMKNNSLEKKIKIFR